MPKELTFIILGLILVLGIIFGFTNKNIKKEESGTTRCPTDLKLCPDGTYVGRMMPSCTFKECPENKLPLPKEATSTPETL